MESSQFIKENAVARTIRKAWRQLRNTPVFRDFSDALHLLNAPTLLFGGFPRLIERGGDPQSARDIDIVIDADSAELEQRVAPWISRRTRFGGFNLRVGTQSVDIWSLRDTWAFRTKAVNLSAVPENLVRTVFLSVDAIAFDLTTSTLYADDYYRSFSGRALDIVLKENPFPALCVLRSLVFAHEYRVRTSPSLRRYIHEYAKHPGAFERLVNAQASHYGFDRVDPSILYQWLLAFSFRPSQLRLFSVAHARKRLKRPEQLDDGYVSCLFRGQEAEQQRLFDDTALAAP